MKARRNFFRNALALGAGVVFGEGATHGRAPVAVQSPDLDRFAIRHRQRSEGISS